MGCCTCRTDAGFPPRQALDYSADEKRRIGSGATMKPSFCAPRRALAIRADAVGGAIGEQVRRLVQADAIELALCDPRLKQVEDHRSDVLARRNLACQLRYLVVKVPVVHSF